MDIIHTEQYLDADNFLSQQNKVIIHNSNAGAIGIILNQFGQIALVQRRGLHPGWALPGGTVENGESANAAFIRESKEELDLIISNPELITIEKKIFISPNNEKLNFWLVVFLAYVETTSKVIYTRDDGVVKTKFFSIESLPNNIILNDRQKVELYLDIKAGHKNKFIDHNGVIIKDIFCEKNGQFTFKYINKLNNYKWWSSPAEYFGYEESLYDIMAKNENKINAYRNAIRKKVQDKIVVDIGTGAHAILAKICIEEGAKKVFAIEQTENIYKMALFNIKKYKMSHKINLIHGNSLDVTLPEKCDVCVSDVFSSIGGLEGAVHILNDAKFRHLKSDGILIPEKSLTMVSVPILSEEDILSKPFLDNEQFNYFSKIFNGIGYEFNTRVCIKGIKDSDLGSTVDIFEELSWINSIPCINNDHKIKLTINKSGKIFGLLVWLLLRTDEENIIDTLKFQDSWIPNYLPVFDKGIKVDSGDVIFMTISRRTCINNFNFDYKIKGYVETSNNQIHFKYTSYFKDKDKDYSDNNFYKEFFKVFKNHKKYSIENLSTYFEKFYPCNIFKFQEISPAKSNP